MKWIGLNHFKILSHTEQKQLTFLCFSSVIPSRMLGRYRHTVHQCHFSSVPCQSSSYYHAIECFIVSVTEEPKLNELTADEVRIQHARIYNLINWVRTFAVFYAMSSPYSHPKKFHPSLYTPVLKIFLPHVWSSPSPLYLSHSFPPSLLKQKPPCLVNVIGNTFYWGPSCCLGIECACWWGWKMKGKEERIQVAPKNIVQ
jgi:hypothetical protein